MGSLDPALPTSLVFESLTNQAKWLQDDLPESGMTRFRVLVEFLRLIESTNDVPDASQTSYSINKKYHKMTCKSTTQILQNSSGRFVEIRYLVGRIFLQIPTIGIVVCLNSDYSNHNQQ